MKKILVFAVILALLAPAAAFAATEFSLGGFIKLDTYWDSTQNSKNINGIVLRGNDSGFQHGNYRATAQGSRFNLTIKGPNVFGAIVTGFLEMDFDSDTSQSNSASNIYLPRLRHAMFRFNWPTTELLFGQYWSYFSEWFIESAEDGPFQATGTPTARLAQIRVTQQFAGAWTVSAMVGDPNAATLTNTNPYNAAAGQSTTNGNDAETPQIQAKVQFAQDLWGKAAFYGKPTPFTAQVAGGWQRSVARSATNLSLSTFQNNMVIATNQAIGNTYVSPWLVMGSIFIPVIPTHTANLAGTAHLLTQWWIGQGVAAFGFTGDATAVFQNLRNNRWAVSLLPRFGGLVEGQYYFTNQWFINAAYGLSKTYGLGQNSNWAYSCQASAANANASVTSGLTSGLNAQLQTMQQVDLTLWYRPVQAIKFGMQYAWARTTYLTSITNPAGGGNTTNFGNEHRVEFVGFFYF